MTFVYQLPQNLCGSDVLAYVGVIMGNASTVKINSKYHVQPPNKKGQTVKRGGGSRHRRLFPIRGLPISD
jgi:hypothetical protein